MISVFLLLPLTLAFDVLPETVGEDTLTLTVNNLSVEQYTYIRK